MKLKSLLIVATLATALVPARAQGPEPDNAQWTQVMTTFAGVVDRTVDRAALGALLGERAWIAPFDRNRVESASLLPDRLPSGTVVSMRASVHPAVTSASDLVADLTASDVDPAILKQFVTRDDRELRLADATMARWCATVLEAMPGDPVAVVAVYEPPTPSSAAAAATQPRLHFVLVRGESTDGGSPRIARVLYGPMESVAK